LVFSIKFTFFNKQQQRADTATNSQPASMLGVGAQYYRSHQEWQF
jgi:hypothetical protein